MISNWDFRTAAANLDIKLVPFNAPELEGRARGYSEGRQLALRPGEPHPVFVGCHELAHIVLGHTILTRAQLREERITGLPQLSAHEIEAHFVALALAERLALVPGTEYLPTQEGQYVLRYASPSQALLYVMARRKELRQAAETIYRAGLR